LVVQLLVAKEKRIWRAKVDSTEMAYGIGDAENFVDRIIERLTADGLM
jgi:hypothetical protein